MVGTHYIFQRPFLQLVRWERQALLRFTYFDSACYGSHVLQIR
eukprot:SAG11_NODE_2194_length_3702_cov_1.574799_2_plen_43_part_00